ncbi:hypothetical protein NA57DRAFT_52985 [Rhizodiscina lignyota]|uniref:Coatomer subunit epsilon n=1 Tax=Rhizodiscina lignyota TaxID=1504668 RepID=A0A9P4MDH5_9PEZI|nr:hypothetical protein NA57DRAFT_52985 [Rhizodiscina lignyota]
MDPYSAEGELVNLHNYFHQAQYAQVIDFDTSALSSSNLLPARVLQLRAKIALSQVDEALSEISSDANKSTPDLKAVQILAQYSKAQHAGKPLDGNASAAEELAKSDGDNVNVQVLCGTVLAGAGMAEEALQVLGKHQGSLDAIALIVQIHLQQNRLDLANKEAQQARKWAQDNLLVNIAESWVGMRQGGEKYQAAYYVFEELAQAPATQSVQSLIGQAVAELHLGRLPEAEAALQQARDLDAENPDLLVNSVVLDTILGKVDEAKAAKEKLAKVHPEYQALADWAKKKEEFEKACERYTPKFDP